MRLWTVLMTAALAASVLLAACGGGGDDDNDATRSAGTATRAASRTPGAGSTPGQTANSGTPSSAATSPAGGSTSAAGGPPPVAANTPPAPSSSGGPTLTAQQAAALVAGASLQIGDLTGPWTVSSDETQDNAAAAAADPTMAASNERCGRLIGRTAVYGPQDLINAFLAGETLSFFSTLTAYATADGANDCATETAGRLQQPGEFARAFGSIFVDPNAVQVQVVDFPQVGDGSFAATLTGIIDAQGTPVNLTILVVGFRVGNVTGAVGSARSGMTPPSDELKPFVDVVVGRVRDAQ
ncbi:MAG: hypothetical protein WEC75_14635 [Dehalococcoidia bacterium]